MRNAGKRHDLRHEHPDPGAPNQTPSGCVDFLAKSVQTYDRDLPVRGREPPDASKLRRENPGAVPFKNQSDTAFLNPDRTGNVKNKSVIVFDDFTTGDNGLDRARRPTVTAPSRLRKRRARLRVGVPLKVEPAPDRLGQGGDLRRGQRGPEPAEARPVVKQDAGPAFVGRFVVGAEVVDPSPVVPHRTPDAEEFGADGQRPVVHENDLPTTEVPDEDRHGDQVSDGEGRPGVLVDLGVGAGRQYVEGGE